MEHACAVAARASRDLARKWAIRFALLGFLSGAPCLAVYAEPAAPAPMQSLDEQVQEVKSEVLSIAAELNRLEERLLYPSNTQVAVFVALEAGDAARFDSVELQLDGELVAHHIYSFKELEALQRGGVQRIYTGNVATGDHRLAILVKGRSSSGSDFAASEEFSFTKEVEPKLVGLTLSGSGSGNPDIAVGGW